MLLPPAPDFFLFVFCIFCRDFSRRSASELSRITQSTGQCLQRPLIAFDAWLLALGR
jgi:hypothetical protein